MNLGLMNLGLMNLGLMNFGSNHFALVISRLTIHAISRQF